MQEALLPSDDSSLTRTGLAPAPSRSVAARGTAVGEQNRHHVGPERSNGESESAIADKDRQHGRNNGHDPAQGQATQDQDVQGRATRTDEQRSDAELLASFREGDEQGFVALYRRRHLEIYRFILRFLHGDEDAAADLFQETFIKIHEHASTLRNGENVRSWMYAIARNNCLNHIKRSRRQVPLGEQHEQIADGDAPDELLHRGTLHGELDRAIRELPDNQREAILLREFEGLSYADIAQATNTNIGIIRQRLWRAKQTLRMMLSPFFADGASAGHIQVEDHE